MNQHHVTAYLKLIQELLDCSSGEEWILLKRHEELVNPELVYIMEQVATQLASSRRLEEAKFLHNLAGQLHHILSAETRQHRENEKAADYLALIEALLECPEGGERQLLTEHQDLIGPGLVKMMHEVAEQLAVEGNVETADYLRRWATELNRVWLEAHGFLPGNGAGLRSPQSSNSNGLSDQALQNGLEHPQMGHPTEPQDDWLELKRLGRSHQFQPPSEPSSPSEPLVNPIKNGRSMAPECADPDDPWSNALEESAGAAADAEAPQLGVRSPEVAIASAQARSATSDSARSLEQRLAELTAAVIRLGDVLAQRNPPAEPLSHMEALEKASASHWLLSTHEVESLIGVKPHCEADMETFERGCWVFEKAGRIGNQVAWKVRKEPVT